MTVYTLTMPDGHQVKAESDTRLTPEQVDSIKNAYEARKNPIQTVLPNGMSREDFEREARRRDALDKPAWDITVDVALLGKSLLSGGVKGLYALTKNPKAAVTTIKSLPRSISTLSKTPVRSTLKGLWKGYQGTSQSLRAPFLAGVLTSTNKDLLEKKLSVAPLLMPWESMANATVSNAARIFPGIASNKAAQFAIPFLQRTATMGGTKFLEKKVAGETTKNALREAKDTAKTSAVWDLGLSGLGYGIENIAKLKKVAVPIGSKFTGINRDLYKLALDDPSILKMNATKEGLKTAQAEAGQKVVWGLNTAKANFGKEINAAEDAYRYGVNKGTKYSSKPIIDDIDDIIKVNNIGGGKATAANSRLRAAGMKSLKTIRKALEKPMTDGMKLNIASDIDDMVNYSKNTINPPTAKGVLNGQSQHALKKVSAALKKDIYSRNPELGKARAKYSALMNIEKKAGAALGDNQIEGTVRQLFKTRPIALQKNLEWVDSQLPQGAKFMQNLRRIAAAEQFNRWLPVYADDFHKNIIGSLGIGGAGGFLMSKNPVAAAGALSFMPVVHKNLIKSANAVKPIFNLGRKALNTYLADAGLRGVTISGLTKKTKK